MPSSARMRLRTLLALALLQLTPSSAHRDAPLNGWADTFDDGDFTSAPSWFGDSDRWSVVRGNEQFVLRTNGPPASDTLHLATPSDVTHGRWSFRIGAPGVNLSTANGARIYLTVDRPEALEKARGYFLQLGTNNADRVELFRQDGSADARDRVRLGRSDPFSLPDSGLAVFHVSRSPGGFWRVRLPDGGEFSAIDTTYDTGRGFGIWVKHTSATAQAYLFDDILADPSADVTPPRLADLIVHDSLTLELRYDEPVLARACEPDAYVLEPGPGTPLAAECPGTDGTRVLLRLALPLQPDTRYLLTVWEVLDLAGNRSSGLQRAFWPVPPAVPGVRDVVINEIWAAPPDDALEFVELYNRSEAAVDLGSFSLADGRRDARGRRIGVELGDTLGLLLPESFAVLAREAASLTTRFPGATVIEVENWPALNNGGDEIALLHAGVPIDSVGYDAGWIVEQASLERRDPDGPSDHPSNWNPSLAPQGATPGRVNTRFAPDRQPPTVTFLGQASETTLVLEVDEPLHDSGLSPSGFTLQDGGHPTDLRLGDEGRRVHLTVPELGRSAWMTVPALSDLTGNVLPSSALDIARLPATGELVVSEIMFDPHADPRDGLPDQREYVELTNVGSYLLTLDGLFWTDAPDERGRSDTLRIPSASTSLPPGALALVFADPDPDVAPFRAAFPEVPAPGPGLRLFGLPRSSLGLGNQGDLLRLHRADRRLLESIAFSPSWHAPDLYNTRGVALERVLLEPPARPDRWTSSVDPSGGTPGRMNSVRASPSAPFTAPGLRLSPDPFSPDDDGIDDVLSIRFRLHAQSATVRVRVFDLRGRQTRGLEEARFAGREGTVIWNGHDDAGRVLPIGVYIVVLEALDVEAGRVERHRAPVVLARRSR